MILLDVHTHSIASGHGTTDTIQDMAAFAAHKGLKVLGISDHAPAMRGAGTVSYFQSLRLAPSQRFQIRILYGAECNLLNQEGALDLDDEILSYLDYAIVSMHAPIYTSGTIVQNTQAYIRAMKHPKVKIIGHCDSPDYPIDFMQLAAAAKEHNVILELNNISMTPDSYRMQNADNCRTLLTACQAYGLPVLLSSDSHGKKQIGNVTYVQQLIEEYRYPDNLILNYHPELFLSQYVD